MRLRLLVGIAVGLGLCAPASAQDLTPAPQSTHVLPSLPGEAVRVTTYDQRPTETGRLARRYKGLTANRTASIRPVVRRARPVSPLVVSPRAAFVRRAGTYFPVIPNR